MALCLPLHKRNRMDVSRSYPVSRNSHPYWPKLLGQSPSSLKITLRHVHTISRVPHQGSSVVPDGNGLNNALLMSTKGFLGGSVVKNLPTKQETQVWSLGWEDPLKKEMAIHSNILAWRIPWTKEPGRLQYMALQRIRHDWAPKSFSFMPISVLYVRCEKGG